MKIKELKEITKKFTSNFTVISVLSKMLPLNEMFLSNTEKEEEEDTEVE